MDMNKGLMAGMGEAMKKMERASKIKEPDIASLECIMAHHEGMMAMIDFEEREGKDSKVKRFCRDMKREQINQLHEMRQMVTGLKRKGSVLGG